MEEMPTEVYVRRSHDSNFRPKKNHRYVKKVMEWMEWEASRKRTAISLTTERNVPVKVNGWLTN